MNYTIEKVECMECNPGFATEKIITFDKNYWPTIDEVYAVFLAEYRNRYVADEVSICYEDERITLRCNHGFTPANRLSMKTFLDLTQQMSVDHTLVRVVPTNISACDADNRPFPQGCLLTLKYLPDAALFHSTAPEEDSE